MIKKILFGLLFLVFGSGITFAGLYFLEKSKKVEEVTVIEVVDFDLNKVVKNCAKLSLIELEHNVEMVTYNDFLWGHSNVTATARAFVSIGFDCSFSFIDDEKKEIVIPHSEVLNCGLNNIQVINEQLSMIAPISFDKYIQCLEDLISKEKEQKKGWYGCLALGLEEGVGGGGGGTEWVAGE